MRRIFEKPVMIDVWRERFLTLIPDRLERLRLNRCLEDRIVVDVAHAIRIDLGANKKRRGKEPAGAHDEMRTCVLHAAGGVPPSASIKGGNTRRLPLDPGHIDPILPHGRPTTSLGEGLVGGWCWWVGGITVTKRVEPGGESEREREGSGEGVAG